MSRWKLKYQPLNLSCTYDMSLDGETFKIALGDRGTTDVYGLRLNPVEANLPELFVWCNYHEEQKCFVHTLSDVWNGYKLATHKEYGEKITFKS